MAQAWAKPNSAIPVRTLSKLFIIGCWNFRQNITFLTGRFCLRDRGKLPYGKWALGLSHPLISKLIVSGEKRICPGRQGIVC
jgi:hypothetical protein